MKRVGFIGYGHLGNMLINGFLSAGVLRPQQVWVSNRTQSKMDALSKQWKGITLANNNSDAARASEILFVCVKPLDVLPVLDEIKNELTENAHLVSAAACVTLSDIESCFSGQVSKVIASVTSEVREGISLLCHNKMVAEGNAHQLENLLGSISKVMLIEEENFEVAADLTSCGPGLIAAIFQNFIDAGFRHGNFSPKDIQRMVITTLMGTAKLLTEKELTFIELMDRVATKGGITEEGVKILNAQLPQTFDEVFKQTLAKHEKTKEKIKSRMQRKG